MRLINCTTLKLEDFGDVRSAPRYWILSHRWGDEEVSYKAFRKGQVSPRAGYEKILAFCKFVREEQYNDGSSSHGKVNHAWVDTCCIDKRSSSELSESINAMYQWYSVADLCVVYLEDLDLISDLGSSVWFTRSWTLQELLGPRAAVFVSRSWQVLGHKCWITVATHGDTCHSTPKHEALGPPINDQLSAVTGIQPQYLAERYQISSHASVARRLSWAASRRATRVEDRAYSLLGILGINLPLLYGEGGRAFRRLQEEIIRTSDDQSVFAWVNTGVQSRSLLKSMLSSAPEDFAACSHLVHFAFDECPAYSMTNRGLELRCSASRLYDEMDAFLPQLYTLYLNCGPHGQGKDRRPTEIILTPDLTRTGRWLRVFSEMDSTSLTDHLAGLKRGDLEQMHFVVTAEVFLEQLNPSTM